MKSYLPGSVCKDTQCVSINFGIIIESCWVKFPVRLERQELLFMLRSLVYCLWGTALIQKLPVFSI
ncbi:hypothetical protein DP092_24595 [Pseudomonas sp. MDMC224]|nr:hypothetical protein DP092_24595 [Pseudomonas sp. MDMC224]